VFAYVGRNQNLKDLKDPRSVGRIRNLKDVDSRGQDAGRRWRFLTSEVPL